MNRKITIHLEQKLLEEAEKYARENNRSISDLINSYLKSLTSKKREKPDMIQNSVVKELRGSFKLPPDTDYKQILQDQLNKKYL